MKLAPLALALLGAMRASATEYCIWDGETRPCDDPPPRYRRHPQPSLQPPAPDPDEARRREEARRAAVAAEAAAAAETESRRQAELQRKKDEAFRQDRDKAARELKSRASDGDGLRSAADDGGGLKSVGSAESGLKGLDQEPPTDRIRTAPAPVEKRGKPRLPVVRERAELAELAKHPFKHTVEEQKAKDLEQVRRGTYEASFLGNTVGAAALKARAWLRDKLRAAGLWAKDESQDKLWAASGDKLGVVDRIQKTAEPRDAAQEWADAQAGKAARRVSAGLNGADSNAATEEAREDEKELHRKTGKALAAPVKDELKDGTEDGVLKGLGHGGE